MLRFNVTLRANYDRSKTATVRARVSQSGWAFVTKDQLNRAKIRARLIGGDSFILPGFAEPDGLGGFKINLGDGGRR